jgi:hypothetical protein
MKTICENVYGWRFWLVWPGDDLLRAPITRGWPVWPSKVERAKCYTTPDHQPPVDGCLCGVYADPTYAMVTARALAYASAGGSLASIAGQPVGYPPAYV